MSLPRKALDFSVFLGPWAQQLWVMARLVLFFCVPADTPSMARVLLCPCRCWPPCQALPQAPPCVMHVEKLWELSGPQPSAR